MKEPLPGPEKERYTFETRGTSGTEDEADWRIVLFPRLTILASLELGAEIFVNTLPPEEAAMRLREI